MDIKSLSDLGKIADLCRKKGIESIKITDSAVEFKLLEHKPARHARKKASPKDSDNIEMPIAPTEEELLFWSSAGIPQEAT